MRNSSPATKHKQTDNKRNTYCVSLTNSAEKNSVADYSISGVPFGTWPRVNLHGSKESTEWDWYITVIKHFFVQNAYTIHNYIHVLFPLMSRFDPFLPHVHASLCEIVYVHIDLFLTFNNHGTHILQLLQNDSFVEIVTLFRVIVKVS